MSTTATPLDAYSNFCDDIGSATVKYFRGNGSAGPTDHWPFASFQSMLTIVLCYLSFVGFGSIFFKATNIKLDLYGLRFIYNLTQIFLCSYMFIEAFVLAYRNGYTVVPDNKFNSKNPPIANLLWLFYISKILDFMDTIFIVTRQKWKQLSFLHVYHHSTIFAIYWLNLRVGYDGDIFFTILANGLVHSVMYTYYLIAMHTRDIWWKSHVTKLQLFQFFLMNVQAIYKMFVKSKYPVQQQFPQRVTEVYLFYILSLGGLFTHFYVQSYIGAKKKKAV